MDASVLTPRQRQYMDALIATGSLKGMAKTCGTSIESVKAVLKRVRAATGMTWQPLPVLAVAYDRATRGAR